MKLIIARSTSMKLVLGSFENDPLVSEVSLKH